MVLASDLRPNILGYHANDADRCKRFIEDSTYLIISPDTNWLGKGMYFWDNTCNLEYWANEKLRKAIRSGNVIDVKKTVSNVFTDNMLDLLDDKLLTTLETLWSKWCSKDTEQKPNVPLGEKIDILFKHFDILSIFSVIRVAGRYNKTIKETRNFLNDNFFDTNKIRTGRIVPHPSQDIKIIYCVREDSSYVVNRNYVEV
ncbi:MAG: hypothetical protein E7231_03290 [Cellulosilyticum sp.]|nr:hypothetical protein [Cellulosilyticum sp.]